MSAVKAAKPTSVWVGLRPCGCCVAVCLDDGAHAKDVNATKREFLKDGLSVVYGTWEEWLNTYLPSMQGTCTHGEAKS